MRQNLSTEIYKKIEELKGYRLKNAEEEKEELNGVLMQANGMLNYRDEIIEAFTNSTFLSEH